MDGVGIVFIIVGILIFISSFMIRIKKSNIEEDLQEAIREFEKSNGGKEDFEPENDDLNFDDEFDSDDVELQIIMGSSRSFFRSVGAVVFVIGLIIYWIAV